MLYLPFFEGNKPSNTPDPLESDNSSSDEISHTPNIRNSLSKTTYSTNGTGNILKKSGNAISSNTKPAPSLNAENKNNSMEEKNLEKESGNIEIAPTQITNTTTFNSSASETTKTSPTVMQNSQKTVNNTNPSKDSSADVDLFADMTPVYKAPKKIEKPISSPQINSKISNNSVEETTSSRLKFDLNETETSNGWGSWDTLNEVIILLFLNN